MEPTLINPWIYYFAILEYSLKDYSTYGGICMDYYIQVEANVSIYVEDVNPGSDKPFCSFMAGRETRIVRSTGGKAGKNFSLQQIAPKMQKT